VRVATLLLTLMGLPSIAWGACPAPYTTDAVLAELGNAEEFLRNDDNAAAGQASNRLLAGLPCLNEILPQMIVGRVFRVIGAGLYASGDQLGGFDWFLTAVEVDPTFTYGLEDLKADHISRLAFEDAKREIQGEPVAKADKTLGPGAHFVDGRKITVPEARLGRPHLYQIQTDTIRSWVMSSNDFPADAYAAPVAAVTTPEPGKKPEKKPKTPTTTPPTPGKTPEPVATTEPGKKPPKTPAATSTPPGPSGPTVLKRETPPEKIPLIIGGALVIGGAGALYYLSEQKHQAFLDSGTVEDADKFRAATNQFFIISASVLAVGAGTLTWGIILDDGAALPAVSVRF